jgi:hypothetical protein
MPRTRGAIFILLLAELAFASASAQDGARAGGQDTPPILDDDPAPLLGLDLAGALARFGAPATVGTVRGEAAWQDDVVFAYAAGYSLFVFGDRVWQLRFAKPYAGSLYGLFIGDPADKALSILGQPYESGEGYFVYRMPYKSFPVRLRLSLKDERLADAYLYRDDF